MGVTAREGKGLDKLMEAVERVIENRPESPFIPVYDAELEEEIQKITAAAEPLTNGKISPRWTALRLIEKNDKLINKISDYIKHDISEEMYGQLNRCAESLARKNWNPQKIK